MQSIRDVSSSLKIPAATLHSWIRMGKIRSEKNSRGQCLVSMEEILSLPRFRKQRPQPAIPAEDAADIQEAMKLTGWHPTTLNKKASMKQLRSYKGAGGRRIFSRAELLKIKETNDRAKFRTTVRSQGRRKCACCGRQPVDPGLRMLCRSCYLGADERSEV